MSFYDNHPYCQPGYGRFATYSPLCRQASPVNMFATPTPSYPSFATQPDYYSLEEEERAAVAHLQTIQRRRQAMEEARARETAIRAHVQAQREAAMRAEIAKHIAREQALHARRVEEERRKKAYLELVERKKAEARALREAQYLQVQRERAIRCPKRLVNLHIVDSLLHTLTSSSRCCRTITRQSPATPEFDEVNALLGALLGIAVKEDCDGESEVKPCCKPKPTAAATTRSSQPKTESRPQPEPEIKPEVKSEPTSASTTESAAPSASSSEEASLNLNKLLSQFLGLQIEPLSSDASTSTASKTNKIPEGLNEFLAQFGLVFEPEEQTAERSCEGTCAGKCQCNATHSCQSSCKKSKGKQVAEIETKSAPSTTNKALTTAATDDAVPAPDPSTSLSALQDIEGQLAALQSGFTFPERLSFAHSVPGAHAPPLLFNRLNSAYHAQTNALLQLLLQADSIVSNGESQVRRKRKELVKKVEHEIQKLEKQRDEKWEEVRERRLNGEESEPEDNDRSWGESSSESGKDVQDCGMVGENGDVKEVPSNQHAADTTACVVSAFDESTASTATVVPQSSESFASVKEALTTPANTSEVLSTPVDEQEQEVPSDDPAAIAQTQSPTESESVAVPASTPVSPVHHPVTVEDAEDEGNKKEGSKKKKQEAKDEGYEMI